VELIFMPPTPLLWFRKTLYNINSDAALQVQSGQSQQKDRVNPHDSLSAAPPQGLSRRLRCFRPNRKFATLFENRRGT
jgi:hypothetical protein